MIDLSGAKVGDKYIDCDGYEVTVALIAKEGICFTLPDLSGFVVCDLNGTSDDGKQEITSKIDNRPWLKDMPDAGIFKDKFKWLACDGDGAWYAYSAKPKAASGEWRRKGDGRISCISAIRMPTLTDDQWKDSLIRIKELREWQEVNK